MTVGDERLLLLLREALREAMNSAAPSPDFCVFEGMNEGEWGELFGLSVRQGVSAVAWDGLEQLPRDLRPPKSVVMPWAARVDGVERNYRRKSEAAAELLSVYRSYGLNVMLLKGLGLSSLYPNPCHRTFSDLDLWLCGEQRRADELLRRDFGIEISEDVHHHTTFRWRGVLVENHYDFVNVHSHASGRGVDAELKRMVASGGEASEIWGESVLLPSADFDALFLMRHMGSHFAADRIVLRHVTDWALFLARRGGDIDRGRMSDLYAKFGMSQFAGAVTSAAVEWLGLPAEAAIECRCDRQLAARASEDILHPEFDETPAPNTGPAGVVMFKIRRWLANRWKHRMVYADSLAGTFVRSSLSHLTKPRTIIGN